MGPFQEFHFVTAYVRLREKDGGLGEIHRGTRLAVQKLSPSCETPCVLPGTSHDGALVDVEKHTAERLDLRQRGFAADGRVQYEARQRVLQTENFGRVLDFPPELRKGQGIVESVDENVAAPRGLLVGVGLVR